MEGHRIEDETLCHELRIDILVAEVLAHVETLLGEDIILSLSCPQTAGTGRGDMHQSGTFLDTEVDAVACASDIDILYLGALGEVLHDSGTVEYRLDVETVVDLLCDIAQHHMDTFAEQRFEGISEVIEEQRTQTTLSCLYRLATYQAVDMINVGINQLAQDMDAQITRSSGDEHIADRLAFALTEGAEGVALKQVVDGGIVVAGYLIGSLVIALTGNEARQFSRCGVGKHITVGHVQSGLVGLDDHTGNHE